MFQKDPFQRLAEALAEMMAVARRRVRERRPEAALEELTRAEQTLAGPLARSLARFDAASAVALLGPEKARVLGELLALRAEAHEAAGEAALAASARRRAADLAAALGA